MINAKYKEILELIPLENVVRQTASNCNPHKEMS